MVRQDEKKAGFKSWQYIHGEEADRAAAVRTLAQRVIDAPSSATVLIADIAATMPRLGVPATTRARFYFYNTPAEIDRLAEGIEQAAAFMGGKGA